MLFAGYGDYRVGIWDTLKCVRQTLLYGHENSKKDENMRQTAMYEFQGYRVSRHLQMEQPFPRRPGIVLLE